MRDYLNGLKWDGTSRVGKWLTTYLGVTSSAYSDAIGEIFLVAMCARIFRPGCQADYMMIWEGGQGTLKSSACRILAGNWFTDAMPDIRHGGKDVPQQLVGLWLIEISELSSMGRSDTETLKSFITRRIEEYQPSYGRKKVRQKRTCLFLGTTNRSVYLRDETGGRRFWPVKVGIIDLAKLTEDRDQLWAEAVHLFNEGTKWWPDAKFAREHIEPEQEKRFEVDAWEEAIRHFLSPPGASPKTSTTVTELARIDTVAKVGTHEQRRITAILEHIEWERDGRDNIGRVKWRRRS